jgi:hypothetical protein
MKGLKNRKGEFWTGLTRFTGLGRIFDGTPAEGSNGITKLGRREFNRKT